MFTDTILREGFYENEGVWVGPQANMISVLIRRGRTSPVVLWLRLRTPNCRRPRFNPQSGN